MANARADLWRSRTLRGIVVFEVLKLGEEEPGFVGLTRDAVVSMLDQKAVDPSTIPVLHPDRNPARLPQGRPPALTLAEPQS